MVAMDPLKLKEVGNNLFRKGEYRKAIETYTGFWFIFFVFFTFHLEML